MSAFPLAPSRRRLAALLGVLGLLPGAQALAAPLQQGDQRATRSGVVPATASSITVPTGPTAQSVIDLQVVKTHAGNFVRGANGTYTIDVSNIGTSPTTGTITMTDNLPAGLSYVSASGTGFTCSASGLTVTCTRSATLAPAQSVSIALTVAVSPTAASTLINRARVATPNEPTTVLGNNVSEDVTNIVNAAPDLAIVKASTTPFVVGQNASYTLTVTNVGSAATTGATTITDALPGGLTFVSATGAGWSCGVTLGALSCSTPSLFAPGASSVVTLTVAVGAAAKPSVTNTATVATPNDPNPTNNTSTSTDPVTEIDVAIDKSHTGTFAVGQNGTYTLAITNVGSATTVGPLTVTDNLPNGLSFVSATGTGWTCSANGQAVSCTNPALLAPAASTSITLTVAVSAAALPSVTNTATVSTPSDQVPGNNTDSDPTPVVQLNPDLAITKTSTGQFVVGQNASYTLAVSNVGAGVTTGTTTITDVLPAGLTFVSASGTGWSCSHNAGTVSCTTSNAFAPGGAASTVTLTVAVGAAARPQVTNTATVSTPNDPNPTNDTSSATDPVRAVDLAIDKSHTGTFTVGQNGTYTLAVTNVGNATTTGAINVSDVLPNGLGFVSASGQGWTCAANGQAVSCDNPGPFAPGASSTITLTVSVALAAAPSVTNTATVTTPGDVVPGNNTDSDPTPIVVPAPDLAITKTSTTAFVVGQNATYSLAITNVGAGPTTAATTITDVLPAGLAFVSAAGTGWSCTNNAGTVSCTTAALFAPNASSTVTLTVAVGASARPAVTNTATVSTPGDPNPTNDTSSVTDPVNGLDVAIAKSHSGNFTVGQNGVYTLTVTNVSAVPTTGPITVTDNLPNGLTFVAASGAGWSCTGAGGLASCTNPGPLGPGASTTIALTVAVGAAAVPSVVNVATVSTPGDLVPGNNTASDPTTIISPSLPDLAITKAGPAKFTVGQNDAYTLTIRNVGGFQTTGTTTVTDVLPNGLTLLSATGTGWNCTVNGQSVSCTTATVFQPGDQSVITLNVAVGNAARPTVTNTGVVKTPNDPNPGNDTSTITTPVDPGVVNNVDLAIVKTAGSFTSGAVGTYTLEVTNNGTLTTAGTITVTDTLPAGTTFASASGGGFLCSASGQVVSCTRTTPLTVKAIAVITVQVNVTAAPTTVLSNTGWVKIPTDINPDNDSSTVKVTVGGGGGTQPPDLKMQKTIVGSVVAGQNVTFRLTITNIGLGSTTSVITVTDPLPAGLSFVSASGAGWSCQASGQLVTCTNPGPMAPNAVRTIDVVAALAAGSSGFSNTATVKTLGDKDPTNDSDTIGIELPVARVDLQTIKTADLSPFTVGQPASYTITVRNVGDIPTTSQITLTDTVPAGLVPTAASGPGWTCTIDGQVVRCTTSAILQPTQTTAVTLNVNVLAAAVPQVRNTARATTPGDDNPDNDTSTTTTPVGAVIDLSLLKEPVGLFRIGGQGRFTLTVRNTGTNDATAPITVRDTLPAGFTFAAATGTGWACTVSGNIVTCTRNTALPAGATSVIDLTGTLGSAALPQFTNCATVSGANETGTLANNTSCATVPVAGEPRLEITKTVSRTEASIGDVLDYTLTVRNTGTADLASAVIVDVLPRGLAYEANTARRNNVRLAEPAGAPGPQLTFSIGQLQRNTPARVTYRVRITAAAALGRNVNVAVVGSPDGITKSDTARASTNITGGLFDERGAIVGKVYTQCNCESLMQEAGEVGIPGVRVYLEDGSSVVTDVEGKYSFYGVSSRLHVVKVDRASLPQGAVMVPIGNRNALDGYSRFADVKRGEMHKADFAEGSGSPDVLQLVLARRRAGEVENAGTQIADQATPESIKIRYTTPVDGVQQSTDSGTGPMRRDATYRPIASAGTLTELNSQLPVTPLRAQAVQQGRNPWNGYGRVEVELPQEGIPADGQTLVSVVVRLMDREGKPLTGRVPVTLEASLGRWLGDEINATEQGRQVIVDGGVGRYTLVAAAQPGRGEVRVTTPDGSQTLPIAFIPVARPMLATGLLNARIDFRSLIKGGNALASDADGFEESLRDWTFDNDSGKVRGGARGALLLKGRVLGDQLLTLSYDSERDRGRTLFRDIRPDEFFPVYGDAGMREFDAQSRRRFYARLDRGPSYTLFGDFQTARSDERRQLGAYDRTLNGAVEHIEGKRGMATLFASQGRGRQVVDEIPGRGISGPYVLTQTSGLVNSERVEIVTRDRNQPTVILSRVALTRFADYTIEPLTGRLLLRNPVPSADANLNPVSIRVTYESETTTGDRYWVYGGNGTLRVTDGVEVGATFAKDENPAAKSQLAGVNATAQLAKGTYAFGELVQTDQGGSKGDAFRVEVRHQSEKLEGRVFAARSDSAFNNTSSTFYGGRTEFGGRFSTALDGKTRLSGEALRTENNTGIDGRRDGAMLTIERMFNRAWRAEFGYRYAKESGNYTPYPGGTPLQLNRGVIDNDVSALRGRINYTLPEKTRSSLFAEYEQDIRDDSHRGAIGGEYIIANRTRLYGRHEWLTGVQGPYGTNQGTSQEYTVFGIDADYLKNTQMFSEYRARDAFAGRDAEASIGLRNRWAVAPGLSVNTSFERVSPLFGTVGTGVNAQTGDALAATGAVEWTRPSLWKTTARLEFRDADNGDNFLASLGYARKLSRDWTLLGRTLWDVFDATQNQTRGWSQLGLAWRQTDRNRWNALMRYENRLTRLGFLGTSPSTENLAHILAGLVNYQPTERFTLSGRYAGKIARDEIGTQATTTNAQLLMGRGIYDLNRRLDLGLIGSVLATDGFGSRQYGLGGELGLIVMRNLRVAGGYNLFGFTDKDLNTFGTTRKGAYLELGFKFDESLFGLGGNEVPCDNACRAGGKKE